MAAAQLELSKVMNGATHSFVESVVRSLPPPPPPPPPVLPTPATLPEQCGRGVPGVQVRWWLTKPDPLLGLLKSSQEDESALMPWREETQAETGAEAAWEQFFADPTRWWDSSGAKASPPPPEPYPPPSTLPYYLEPSASSLGFRDQQQQQEHEQAWRGRRGGATSASEPGAPAAADGEEGEEDEDREDSFPPPSPTASPPHPGRRPPSRSDLRHLRTLCARGHVSAATDAASQLLRRGRHVSTTLFYALLKQCRHDLPLGRRIHALACAAGHRGDAFLATHLIGMYAAHGAVDDARRVMAGVPAPDAHNYAALLLALVRHDRAAEAVALYRHGVCARGGGGGLRPDDRVFSAALKACAGARDLAAGREVHARIVQASGPPGAPPPGRFVQSGLVNMYAKCGDVAAARAVFDALAPGDRDVVTWTAMVAGYAQAGQGAEALRLWRSGGCGVRPDAVTYVCLLQACASVGAGALEEGRRMHAQMAPHQVADVVVGGSLVNMYAKCGSLEDARAVLDGMPPGRRSVVAWTAMIAGYAQAGQGAEALHVYRAMRADGRSEPNAVTYVCVLQACAGVGAAAAAEGARVHAEVVRRGLLAADVALGGCVVNMYAKCGQVERAREVFDGLPERNVVAWTAMLAGYAQQGLGAEALRLYAAMKEEGGGVGVVPNAVTYRCLLQACASVGGAALEDGKRLHHEATAAGLLLSEQEEGQGDDGGGLGGALVNMYAKCGTVEDARAVFDALPERSKDVVTWTAMIAGYAQAGRGEDALRLYKTMQQEQHATTTTTTTTPDCVTYVSLLQACASVGVAALEDGQRIHALIRQQPGLQDDPVLGGSLVNMYAKCGRLRDAREVLDRLPARNVVACNAMLATYAQHGRGADALALYRLMEEQEEQEADPATAGDTAPSAVTFVCLLQACAGAGAAALGTGRRVHAQAAARGMVGDVVVGGSLVNMYAKCGDLDAARAVFDGLPLRNVVAYNAMVAGYAAQGVCDEAWALFQRMRGGGEGPDVAPNAVTYVCVLQSCAAVAALPLGERLHALIAEEQAGWAEEDGGIVGAALVNMYAKCGSMYDAQRVFDALPTHPPTLEAWGALVGGYARHGDADVVFALVERMRRAGVPPDGVTVLSVLTACAHAGLVDRGWAWFRSLASEEVAPEHVICMVDMLGRAGRLSEALDLALSMTTASSSTTSNDGSDDGGGTSGGGVWHTLLSACWKWRNVEIGQRAFHHALRFNPSDAAAYVLMANTYAAAGRFDAAGAVQARRKRAGAWKPPGQSWWTDPAGRVHAFRAGDTTHPDSAAIRARIRILLPAMKRAGYVPHLGSALQDGSDGDKEAELCAHSEKLAIAYALTQTEEGATIRVVKNLRVCEDCHAAVGVISKVEKRVIVCRDATRFHVYKDGKCSCGGYW